MAAQSEESFKKAPIGPRDNEPPKGSLSTGPPALRAKRPSRARRRSRPDQAGFFRRSLAFAVDVTLITLAALILYVAYSEARGARGGEPGIITQFKSAPPGQSVELGILISESAWQKRTKEIYLTRLRTVLPEEEYLRASKMSAEELKGAFHEDLAHPDIPLRLRAGHDFEIIQELLIGYLFFIAFFRFGGRTPGKRLLGLKVVDLSGRPRLTWYQAFERTHGYAASLLVGGIGFFQVLWDKGGLTMHDKLAGTTVVRLPKRPRPNKRPAPAAPASEKPGETPAPASSGRSTPSDSASST